jgi:hypothetical protein
MQIDFACEHIHPGRDRGRHQRFRNVQSKLLERVRHGTVGMVDQGERRVSDTARSGTGNYARSGFVAVSCPRDGEVFIQGIASDDISATDSHTRARLANAFTTEAEVKSRGAPYGSVARFPVVEGGCAATVDCDN